MKWKYISHIKVIALFIVCLAFIGGSADSRVQAIFAGALTFAINAGAVALIAGRLFRGTGQEGSDAKPKSSNGFLLVALIVKVFGLGLGIYLSLVLAQLSPSYFVAGALTVLLVSVASRIVGNSLRIPKDEACSTEGSGNWNRKP